MPRWVQYGTVDVLVSQALRATGAPWHTYMCTSRGVLRIQSVMQLVVLLSSVQAFLGIGIRCSAALAVRGLPPGLRAMATANSTAPETRRYRSGQSEEMFYICSLQRTHAVQFSARTKTFAVRSHNLQPLLCTLHALQ
jgi:hypothetical protein